MTGFPPLSAHYDIINRDSSHTVWSKAKIPR